MAVGAGVRCIELLESGHSVAIVAEARGRGFNDARHTGDLRGAVYK